MRAYLSREGRQNLQGPRLDLGPLALWATKLIFVRNLVEGQNVELFVLWDVAYCPVILLG